MRTPASMLIFVFAVMSRGIAALPSVGPSPEAYKHICETTSFPDIPCFTFWRSDLKDAYLGEQLNKGNLLIKNDTYKDFGYTDVNHPFSVLFNDQVELLYGGRNDRNCTQLYVSKQWRYGKTDYASARVEVRDEDGNVLHDSRHPSAGWASNCKKWTHIKVWHG